MKKIALSFFAILVFHCCFAQIKAAKIKDLTFMSGLWTQKGSWGEMEEFWGQPMGDGMVSSFRVVDKGKTVFYEFVVIEEERGLPIMKLRHFNRGSVAWEDKDKPLVLTISRLTKNEVEFVSKMKQIRLVYKRSAPDKLDVTVYEKDKNGTWQPENFNYTLKQK